MIPQALSDASQPGPAGQGFPPSEGASQMLKDAQSLSSFAVDDVTRAREFYGTTLGLDVADAPLGVEGADVPAGLEIRLGSGTRIGIYPKPDHTGNVHDPELHGRGYRARGR